MLTDNADMPEENCDCKFCGDPTAYTGTQCCNQCWELKNRIPAKPNTAKQVLAQLRKMNFKTVGVKYATSSQVYTFMTDEDCEVGDKAVVFTNGSWSVVTIVEVHDEPKLDGDYKYTWLVQVVDRTNYDRHIQEDGEGYPKVGDRL